MMYWTKTEWSNALLLQALQAELSQLRLHCEQLEARETGLGWCLERYQDMYAALTKVSSRAKPPVLTDLDCHLQVMFCCGQYRIGLM